MAIRIVEPGSPRPDADGTGSGHTRGARQRLRYLLLACVTIAVGMAVHVGPLPISPRLRDAAGDALWATMMVWWVGVVAPGARSMVRCVLALAVCVAVELSQRYHVAWLDAIRATTLGHLVLGSGFDARDLVAYAVGVGVAAVADRSLLRSTA